MAHNTNSNKKKETKIQKVIKKKNIDIGLHQATDNSCIMHIIFCISNICTHLTPFLTSMSSLIKLTPDNDLGGCSFTLSTVSKM